VYVISYSFSVDLNKEESSKTTYGLSRKGGPKNGLFFGGPFGYFDSRRREECSNELKLV
jgi:hypothetical protein